jgi:BASS family bile acid:Na+ symporter
MNPIFIVLPILTLLMFDLGLTLRPMDFVYIAKRPKAAIVGLTGQLVILPLVAFVLASLLHLSPYYFIGIVLVACCPGGSSSNIFSLLAKGDVALSVSMTAVSSIVTLFTVPIIMQYTTAAMGETVGVTLPVGNLLLQNGVTMLLPIIAGISVRHYWSDKAMKMERVLTKCAFPALMLVVVLFYIQHRDTIMHVSATTLFSPLALILVAIFLSAMAGKVMRLNSKEQRTIIIEVGMQNAAQAIAIASSPFIFGNDVIAVPAIIYSLMMNIVLLSYVAMVKRY